MSTDYAPKHSVAHTLEQFKVEASNHAPRILILYGSLRACSYSKKLALESQRILEKFGAQVRVFDPSDLPVYNGDLENHPEVIKLREWAQWSEGMVWSSPELHGNMSGVMKNQIDWIPLSIGSIRPTQGRTLALMQVSGGSQSFNAVNNMRILGRWMRMFTIPNQSSVAMAYKEFNEDGTMKESSFRDRLVDVMEELFRITLLMRDHTDVLTERYSENKQTDA